MQCCTGKSFYWGWLKGWVQGLVEGCRQLSVSVWVCMQIGSGIPLSFCLFAILFACVLTSSLSEELCHSLLIWLVADMACCSFLQIGLDVVNICVHIMPLCVRKYASEMNRTPMKPNNGFINDWCAIVVLAKGNPTLLSQKNIKDPCTSVWACQCDHGGESVCEYQKGI